MLPHQFVNALLYICQHKDANRHQIVNRLHHVMTYIFRVHRFSRSILMSRTTSQIFVVED